MENILLIILMKMQLQIFYNNHNSFSTIQSLFIGTLIKDNIKLI